MTWIHEIIKTYDYLQPEIGKYHRKNTKLEQYTMFSPIYHKTKKPDIILTLDDNGRLIFAEEAEIVAKGKSKFRYSIPVSEKSGARNDSSPHGLHDLLKTFISPETKKEYLKQLYNWKSQYPNQTLESVYKFIKKSKDVPKEIEKLGISSSKVNSSAMIIFKIFDDIEPWENKDLMESWINLQISNNTNELKKDSINGKDVPQVDKLATTLTGAKLISNGQQENLTSGMFENTSDAFMIGTIDNQKISNTIEYLSDIQSTFTTDDEKVIIWQNEEPTKDLNSNFWDFDTEEDDDSIDLTNVTLSKNVIKNFKGYSNTIELDKNVNLLKIQQISKGRIVVKEFKTFNSKEYFTNRMNWTKKCQSIFYNKSNSYIGSPSVDQIVNLYFNNVNNIDSTKRNELYYKIQNAIIKNEPVSEQILNKFILNSLRPQTIIAYENLDNQYLANYKRWQQTMLVTCALINYTKYAPKVSLDTESKDQSYLYGRLLACLELLELKSNHLTNFTIIPTKSRSLLYQAYNNPKFVYPTIIKMIERLSNFTEQNIIKTTISSIIENLDLTNELMKLSNEFFLGYVYQLEELKPKQKIIEE